MNLALRLTLGAGYNSATGPGTPATPRLAIVPELRLTDPILGIAGMVSADVERYAAASAQNSTNVTAVFGWRIGAGPDRLDLGMAHAVLSADALTLATASAALPYPVTLNAARSSIVHHFGLFSLHAQFGPDREAVSSAVIKPAFSDATALNGAMSLITTFHAL